MNVDLHPQQQGHFQQDQLQLPNACTGDDTPALVSRSWDVDHTDSLTDVVYGAGAELPIELFGPEAPQIMNGERPQVKHVVTGK